jgi:hypothetical protein
MMMKTAMALLAAGALAFTAATPAAADPPAKHRAHARTLRHPVRHAHRPPGPDLIYGRPFYLGPSGPGVPGYNYGGPTYSTCDRINADRMLVGTCR